MLGSWEGRRELRIARKWDKANRVRLGSMEDRRIKGVAGIHGCLVDRVESVD